MKYLILSDIHGNLEALQAVLSAAASMKIDKYVILGDLVGYGADPNEVMDCIRRMSPVAVVRGNHDKVAVGLSDGRDFNYAARDAALWTRKTLSSENTDYLTHLPRGPVEVDTLFDIVHGSPWDEDYYLFRWHQVLTAFQQSDKRLVLFGHTHIPTIWTLDGEELSGDAIPGNRYEHSLEGSKRYLINPGSVGQPRDRNSKAALAVLDTDEMTVKFLRVKYNVKGAQAKIRRTELSKSLADRLSAGR